MKKILPYLFLALISLIGIWSFFYPGFFPSHDGEWMVVRFSDFHRSLVDGQWPVRFAGRLNFGYGYPVFNFLYPGTFYLTEIFHLLKFNFVDSVEAMFVASFLLSAISMYLFSKEWVGKLGAMVAAVLYMYTPYHFVDMYVRGSLGESVAFVFPPLIFWAITKFFLADKNKRLWVGIGALGTTGLITTHNVIAYLFLPIITLFILCVFFVCKRSSVSGRKLFLIQSMLALFLGLGFSMFFWLPALWDKQYTIFDQVVISDFSKNFPSISELIFPSWGFGPSRPGDPNSMSFQVGVVNLIVLITIVFFLIKRKLSSYLSSVIPTDPDSVGGAEGSYSKEAVEKDSSTSLGMTSVMLFFLTITLLSIFFMTSYSQSFWPLIPGLSLIQFPWRILSVTTFTTSVLAGFLLKEVSNNRLKYILAVLIIILSITLNFSYTKPKEFVNRGEGYYFTNDDTTTVQDEYLPVRAKNLPRRREKEKVEIVKGQGIVSNLSNKSNKTNFSYKGTEGILKINTVYFPGWQAFINGRKEKVLIDNYGLINIKVEDGSSKIDIVWKETLVRKISDVISGISLLIIITLICNNFFGHKITLQRKFVSHYN